MRALLLLVALAAVPAFAAGNQSQQAAGSTTPATPSSSVQRAASSTAEQPAPEPYAYQPEGRRDPFVSALRTGVEPRLPAKRTDGSAGLTVGEISVRGVVQSKGALLA